jgi:hypothetical protein
LNHSSKGLQLADDELQRASLLGFILQHLGFAFQLGDALSQARNPGLELRFADHRLGIAVDQPTNTAPQLIELALDGIQLGPTRSSAQLLQASLVLLG